MADDTTTPAADGIAAVGTLNTFARGDHIHPAKPILAFGANRNGIANAAAAQTPGQVAWTLEYDLTGGFANNVFTVPAGQNGLWMFNAAVYFKGSSGTTAMEIGIYVNGSRRLAIYGQAFETGGQGHEQVFGILNLNVNDVVSVRIAFFYTTGFARNDAGVSWFVGVKL
jgi:hypothetical protein